MDVPLLALTRRRRGALAGRSPQAAATENMRELIQLRWVAVGGQLLAILATHFAFAVPLPLAPMLAVVALLTLANLLFQATLGRSWMSRHGVLLALLLDMAALTAQLYLSGGATNPFISLYLLQVVLGAILLRPAMVWLLAGLAILCWSALGLSHLPLRLPATLWNVSADLRLIGEMTSFAMVAVLLVLFIARISRNLRAREAYVVELGQRAAEEDGIVRMGLFASGAAHELGTPLSSLSVLVADWQREPALAGDPRLGEELAEARSEIERCKEIVSNILHSAGLSRGEAMRSVPADALLDEIVAAWRALNPSSVLDYRAAGLTGLKVAAEPALRQAVWSLLENGAEAAPERTMTLAGEASEEELVIGVMDEGPGFAPEQLGRIGQLHESSKGPGHGVGLFLASNVARRLGGRLDAANRPRAGAVVRLHLPLAAREPAREE